MYTCKHCKRPIEQAIEGELVCPACHSQEDMLSEQEEIAYLASHCPDCGASVRGGGYCPDCQAENDQVLASLRLEHQGKTALVHWRGPGAYVPIQVWDDSDIIYYHANDNPWGNEPPADGWPTIMAESWHNFEAVLEEDGVTLERKDVPKSDLRRI